MLVPPVLPADLTSYRQTPVFSQDTVPKGLLAGHQLKAGSWGQIRVLSGQIDYVIEADGGLRLRLNSGMLGVVPPLVPHHLELCGPVEFYVEFLREPGPS